MLQDKLLYNIQGFQVLAFLIALLISYLLTPVIQLRAKKLGLLDKPSERKIHTSPIPRLGGVSIFISLFVTSLVFIGAYFIYKISILGSFSFLGILGGGVIIFLLGLLDDIEPMPAAYKLLIQILAASVAWYLGVRIEHLVNPFYHANLILFKFSIGDQFFHFGWMMSYFLTVLWIIAITNAINLIDGMDGLATGVSLVSAIAIWAVAVDFRISQPAGALMAATLAGSLLGFLRWNFNPARIFLGDSGAYLTGFVLACLSIGCVLKKITLAVMAPVLILLFGLPLLDTSFAVIRRLISGKSIFQPDRGHLHHRLLAIGISQKFASYVMYLISAALGLLATYIISFKSSLRFILLSGIIILIALFYTFIINWRRQKVFRKLLGKKEI